MQPFGNNSTMANFELGVISLTRKLNVLLGSLCMGLTQSLDSIQLNIPRNKQEIKLLLCKKNFVTKKFFTKKIFYIDNIFFHENFAWNFSFK